MLIQKTKTISFRLSDREYRRLHEACASLGVRSISELARSATQRLIAGGHLSPVEQEVLDLRARLQSLAADLHDLTQRIQQLQRPVK